MKHLYLDYMGWRIHEMYRDDRLGRKQRWKYFAYERGKFDTGRDLCGISIAGIKAKIKAFQLNRSRKRA